MEIERITFVRDGKFYQTDRDTVEVLKAVQKWDHGAERNVAQEIFERGLKNGRIAPGSVRAQGQTVDRIVLEQPDGPTQAPAYVRAHRGRSTGHGQEL